LENSAAILRIAVAAFALPMRQREAAIQYRYRRQRDE